MKKIKVKFNKNIFKKYIARLVAYRKLFFALFFCVLLVFTSNVIYKNTYYNMNNIDYAKSGNFESDEMKKNVMFKKVIENIKLREQVTQNVGSRNYRNPFSFNDEESLNKNNDNNNESNNEEDDSNEGSGDENNNESGDNDDSNNGSDGKNDDLVVSPVELLLPLMH